MKRIFSFFIVVFLLQNSFAQKNKNQEYELINHRVELGETIKLISKKYLVNPGEIYQLNKFAVNGISQGMILQIPVPVKDPVEVEEKIKDLVKKEVETVAETKGKVVKPVASIVEVSKPQSDISVIDRSSQISHIVEAKETLYSLSRKYGISVDEIKLSNPQIETSGLQVGMTVKIPGTKKLQANESSIGSTKVPSVEVKSSTSEVVKNTTASVVITHVVEPKETLYSLSKKYGVTVDDITNQNATLLIDGLKIGQTLTIKK